MPTGMAKAFSQSQEATEFGSQMGCMATMFHIFDRRRLLSGRRHGDCPGTMNQLPPTGHTLPVSSTRAPVPTTANSNITVEKSFSKSKSATENSTFSTESSRASAASPSCSSLSSLDSSKPAQQKLPCINEKPVVPRSRTMRSSRSFKSSDTELKSKQQKTDFRDVVKDSINQDSRVLAIKTKMMAHRDGLHKDSPRPLLISKSTDGTYVIAIDRSNVPPAYVDESSRRPCLSRDDRQLLLQVAQDSKMPSSKLRDLPRLSLDSRDEYVKTSLCLKNFGYARTDDSLIDNLRYQESPSPRWASGAIAKLMGLEETLDAPGSARSHRPDHHTQSDHLSNTSRSIGHDLGTLQPKIQPTILKTKPSPRIVPEAAPWKQQKISTTRYYGKEGPSSTSISNDVERRLSNLTMLECNKDLRALRILRELHAKRDVYNVRSLTTEKAAAGQTNSAQDFQSPVVIMKPAKGITKQNASVATLAGTKVHRKLSHEERPFSTKTDNSDRMKTHSHNQRAHSRREEDVGSTISPKPSRILSPRLVHKSDCGRITKLTVPLMSPPNTSKEVSPRGRLRSRASQSNSICSHDKAMIPESKISLLNQVDTRTINDSNSNTLNVNTSSIHQRNTTSRLNYEETLILCTDKNNHPLENIPSPVSVLDATFYQDVRSSSLRSISNSFKNVATLTLDECWNTINLLDTQTLKKSSESNHIIPENMKAIIQKLELLQFLSDESPKTNDNSLIVTTNKDRHYIYEILSACGLLHSELNFRMMPCLLQQPSYPINPELFLVLEQAKPTAEKLHRKLIFDLANELIAKKIYNGSSVREPMQFIQCKKSSGWHLFKELCTEIEMLRSEASTIRSSEAEEEEEESKLAKNAVCEMGKWKSFGSELQGMVLDIERSIFKNLIDEVTSGEGTGKV